MSCEKRQYSQCLLVPRLIYPGFFELILRIAVPVFGWNGCADGFQPLVKFDADGSAALAYRVGETPRLAEIHFDRQRG